MTAIKINTTINVEYQIHKLFPDLRVRVHPRIAYPNNYLGKLEEFLNDDVVEDDDPMADNLAVFVVYDHDGEEGMCGWVDDLGLVRRWPSEHLDPFTNREVLDLSLDDAQRYNDLFTSNETTEEHMTVAKLIAVLQKMPPDATVFVEHGNVSRPMLEDECHYVGPSCKISRLY